MVECLQNIVKHCEAQAHSIKDRQLHNVFTIGKEQDAYVVISGNPVANEVRKDLKASSTK